MTFTFTCVHTGLCTTPGGRVRARFCLTRKQNMWESQVGGLEIKGQNSPVTRDGDACGWIAAETHVGGVFRWKPFNSSRVECAFSLFWSKEEKGSKGCRGPGGSHTHKGKEGNMGSSYREGHPRASALSGQAETVPQTSTTPSTYYCWERWPHFRLFRALTWVRGVP